MKRILVVDDEKEFRFSVRIALRKAGYRAEAAGDGSEALAKIEEADQRNDSFGLIVVDIRMPGMSGVELIEELCRRGVTTPVIVMSCFVETELLRQLARRGYLDILEKPFPPQELVARIGERLAGSAIGGDCREPAVE